MQISCNLGSLVDGKRAFKFSETGPTHTKHGIKLHNCLQQVSQWLQVPANRYPPTASVTGLLNWIAYWITQFRLQI